MNPKEYRYTEEHEWFCPEPGGRGRVGITDHAQSTLGDIVFLNLPSPGTELGQFKKMGEVESIKAVSDIFAPVSGRVIEVNQEAVNDPRVVNDDPYGRGWLIRVELSPNSGVAVLLDAERYDKLIFEIKQGEE